jgi:hypothetical protein
MVGGGKPFENNIQVGLDARRGTCADEE